MKNENNNNESSTSTSKSTSTSSTTTTTTTTNKSDGTSIKATDNNSNKNKTKNELSSIVASIHIISATYGPDHGRRLYNGEWSNTEQDRIPYTRDVLPFLRTMMMNTNTTTNAQNSNNLNPILMKERSMNVLFGDPCPGVTKQLRLHYYYKSDSKELIGKISMYTSEMFRVSYGEHERVVIDGTKRIMHTTITKEDDNDISSQVQAQSQEITTTRNNQTNSQWKLRSHTSEIIVPMIVPYLTITCTASLQLVCSTWRNIIQELGVAQILDVRNLLQTLKQRSSSSESNTVQMVSISRSYLLGVLSNSYTSLRSLYLNDSILENEIVLINDLHDAIPRLRQLQNLDISRCVNVNDTTLQLIATHLSNTIQVLYLKGLHRITNIGIIAIAQHCTYIRVLDISYLSIGDESIKAIGYNLKYLEAFYARDNYLITDQGIQIVTTHCKKLLQLSLWGCFLLSKLYFFHDTTTYNNNNSIVSPSPCRTTFYGDSRTIVCLNLWGCHALTDDVVDSMGCLKSLKSLIVSECHRLSDVFVINLAQRLPQIQHLHLRYLRKITDESINAISIHLKNIYVLDLSFCTKITSQGISNLLSHTAHTLSELKLYHCRQIDHVEFGAIVSCMRSLEYCALGLLDVRFCNFDLGPHSTTTTTINNTNVTNGAATHGNHNLNNPNNHNAHDRQQNNTTTSIRNSIRCLVQGMQFEHKICAFFVRSVRWKEEMKHVMIRY